MSENQINELLDRLEKLAAELRDSDIKAQYDTKENHIQTVRTAIAIIVSNTSRL